MRTILPKNARLIPEDASLAFQGVIYDVYQWQQQMFDGSNKTFEMLKRPDTIKILAINDGKIVILEEQQPSRGTFYTLPEGRHDFAKETELEAAKRELLEETGLTFRSWKLIDITQPVTKIEWFVYTFIATDLDNQTEQHLDGGEKIALKYLSLGEVKELAKDPKAHYLPKELFAKASDIKGLAGLPEYVA